MVVLGVCWMHIYLDHGTLILNGEGKPTISWDIVGNIPSGYD
jgi:hypothetical protein